MSTDVRVGFRGAVYARYVTCSTYQMQHLMTRAADEVDMQQMPISYQLEEVKQCDGCGARQWEGNRCAYCRSNR
jgi:hypothetical protein